MVKDEFHKTRSLCTESEEINIAREKSVFTLIYKIQEEVPGFLSGAPPRQNGRRLKNPRLKI
jgi:hypothetical protein